MATLKRAYKVSRDGAVICVGGRNACAHAIGVDEWRFDQMFSGRAPSDYQIETADAAEVLAAREAEKGAWKRKPPKLLPDQQAAIEQKALIRRNGCRGCSYWGDAKSGRGSGCGYLARTGRRRSVRADGCCGSRTTAKVPPIELLAPPEERAVYPDGIRPCDG